MSFRKLRITLTAFCGMLCVLLIAFWVRSYYIADILLGRITITRSFNVASGLGKLGISDFPDVYVKRLARIRDSPVSIGEFC
jgi:hypothetical protein